MTIKEQLWQEIESSSDELLSETLDFLQALKTKETKNTDNSSLLINVNRNQYLCIICDSSQTQLCCSQELETAILAVF